jgi:hypothetical protein
MSSFFIGQRESSDVTQATGGSFLKNVIIRANQLEKWLHANRHHTQCSVVTNKYVYMATESANKQWRRATIFLGDAQLPTPDAGVAGAEGRPDINLWIYSLII